MEEFGDFDDDNQNQGFGNMNDPFAEAGISMSNQGLNPNFTNPTAAIDSDLTPEEQERI